MSPSRAARLLLISAPSLGLPAIARSATITVTTTADAIDHSGDCSLREAVIAAGSDVAVDGCAAGEPSANAVDEIRIPAGTYTLTLSGLDEGWRASTGGTMPYEAYSDPHAAFGDLDLTDSVRVVGAGAALTVIQWGPGADDRVFHVVATGDEDIEVTLVGLTARGGSVGSEIVNPGAPQEWEYARLGGAIAAGPGGAVAAVGASGPADEGGPPDDHTESSGEASLVLEDVVVADSFAAGGGGGLFSGGALTATGLVAESNVTTKNGGGVYQEGPTLLSASRIVGNEAEGGGGFFATGNTTGTIGASLVADNLATGGGGMSIRSLVDLTLQGTTVRGNHAVDVGGGLIGNGAWTLLGCSVVDNLSDSDAGFGGAGITIFASGSATLRNTVLANNADGTGLASCGCTGGGCSTGNGFSSGGHNLEDADTCALDDASDLASTAPMLSAYADFGGWSAGYLPLPGSPLVDAGDDTDPAATDGRGSGRVEDGDGDGAAHVDIGAFELSPLEVDDDGDGWCEGLALSGEPRCADGTVPGDCGDASDAQYPGHAEVCDGLDDDCNGLVDDTLVFEDWYPDNDGDGFGDGAAEPVATCDGAPAGYLADHTDCDDDVGTAFPGADETCDGLDDDCDGAVDETDAVDAPTWYLDTDGDGYGVNGTTEVGCDVPDGFAAASGDCDPADPAVNPGVPEDFHNGVDDDCDGAVDRDDSEYQRGCGCDATAGSPVGAAIAGLLALLIRRRRT